MFSQAEEKSCSEGWESEKHEVPPLPRALRSRHLVRLSRKSQEREGSCADQSDIEAHWLDWGTLQKANPPKLTAAQSISGNEATENDSQEYGEGDPAYGSQRDLRERHGTNSQRRKGFPITFPITHLRDFLGQLERPLRRGASRPP